MSNGMKVGLLALACFATSISEFAIVGMIDVVAESAGVSVAMAGQLLTAFALSGGIGVPIVVMALAKLEGQAHRRGLSRPSAPIHMTNPSGAFVTSVAHDVTGRQAAEEGRNAS